MKNMRIVSGIHQATGQVINHGVSSPYQRAIEQLQRLRVDLQDCRSRPRFIQSLADCLAETIRADRVVFYRITEQGDIQAYVANDPSYVEESHYRDPRPAEGPLKSVQETKGFQFFPSIDDGEQFFFSATGQVTSSSLFGQLDETVTQRYKHDFGANFGSSASMALLFGCLFERDHVYGVIKADWFLSGRHPFEFGFDNETILDIPALITGEAAVHLTSFEQRMALDAQAQAAQRTMRMVTDLMSRVEHDLKSSLNAALGYLTLLARKPGDPARAEKILEVAPGNIHRMIDYITQVVAPLIRSGTFEIPIKAIETNLSQAFTDELKLLHDVTINNDVPETVILDPLHFRSILYGLIENAEKYGRAGSPIRIVFSVITEGGTNYLEVRVIDQGKGIGQENLERIFERRTQLDDSRSGSGMGLYLARESVTMMGGKIWAESDGLGHGSTFVFTVPIRTTDL
ncbi:hypothetical protein A3J44_02030 [candidate division WOR-1 bacterium RIFCSPHIGHO2_02_FULL_45_12]|nr:MAG: hypothetical protein A3J44_02030 [candidate division WOR-1 bacterium RIFCSPHIGHO2_02_FULL_45_12]